MSLTDQVAIYSPGQQTGLDGSVSESLTLVAKRSARVLDNSGRTSETDGLTAGERRITVLVRQSPEVFGVRSGHFIKWLGKNYQVESATPKPASRSRFLELSCISRD